MSGLGKPSRDFGPFKNPANSHRADGSIPTVKSHNACEPAAGAVQRLLKLSTIANASALTMSLVGGKGIP
jgi:hypothetical protein